MAAEPGNLYQLLDLAHPAKTRRLQENLPAVKAIADWVRDYLCQPNPRLGRLGTVCPYVPSAITKGTLWIAPERIADKTELEAVQILAKYKDLFFELEPKDGDESHLKTILVVFADLPDERAQTVDRIQQALKDSYVRDGLMIGEFHKSNNAPGIHNPEFRPLQSPVPMLAIRYMVLGDWRFLIRSPEWVHAWLRRFHSEISPGELVHQLKELIQAIEAAQTTPSS